MTCYSFEGKILDQQQLIERITEVLNSGELPEISSYIFSLQSDVAHTIEDVIKTSKGKVGDKEHYIGVSNLLEQPLYVGERDVRGNPIKSILSPIYNKQNRIDNSLDNILPLVNGNREEAIKLIEDQISEESAIADVGDLIHNLIHEAISNHEGDKFGYDSQNFKEALAKVKDQIVNSKDHVKDGQMIKSLSYILEFKETSTPSIDQIIDKIYQVVKQVETSIYNNPQYKNARIYSEADIATDNIKNLDNVLGVGGRTDLLIVKEDGSVEIVDFKISSRPFNDWYMAKTLHTDYQLGLYRAILGANGIDTSKVKLQVYPIHFPIGRFSQIKIEPMQNRILSTNSKVSHLDNELGSFTKKINFLFNFPVSPFAISDEHINDSIQENLNKIIDPFKSNKRNYSKEDLKNRIFPKQINGKTLWCLTDINTGEQILKKSKEDFETQGILDKMLSKRESLLTDTMEHIIELVDQYKASGKILDKYDFRNNTNDSNQNVYNVLNSTFGKYCSEIWERVTGTAGDILAN